ncbi:MAG: nucleotidyltransferase family protein [Kofleriaceae bacterium]|nr:nucleotidyltransferase family protein [Kofleriaceae bacterium]
MIGVVILAAGAGTRLGGVAKALLPARDGATFLSSILETARTIGLGEAIVVVGPPFGDAVRAAAEALGARVVVNEHPERGMASSVAIGFGALTCDAAWLWPVDHPHVDASTLRSLLAAIDGHDAARPVFEGRGGHPPLVARSLFAALAACTDAPGGARSVLARHDVIDVAVTDPGVVRDIDTPSDLEAR